MLTTHLNGRDTPVVGPKHASSRAVAEERRGDYVRLRQFVEPEGQGANFDHNEQHNAARTRTGQAGRNREPGNAAGAAKSEDRDSLDIGAKPYAPGDSGFEAGRRDASRRYRDDSVDFGSVKFGGFESVVRRVDKEPASLLKVGARALWPAQRR